MMISKEESIYAIYKGDKFLFMGTKKECASYLKVEERTILWYTYPTYKKRCNNDYNNRLVIIKVEGEEDEKII